MSLRERLGLEQPVVGAGMGGGLSRARLTVAIAEAGGLGQIGILPPPLLRAEIAAHRERSSRPVAVNLLLPFTRRAHWDAAREADVVVTFWGEPRRPASGVWVHPCGSVEEARAAAQAGADAVIAQGVEAGGHVRGTTPMLQLLERVRAAVTIPVLAAGGIIDAEGVRATLDCGAVAAVAGTRFLLSDESHAHPDYKQRCLDASETILTELFGLGWPDAPHRVIPNGATRRWLRGDPRGPRWIRTANRLTAPLASRIPTAVQDRAITTQRPSQPFLGPQPPSDDGPANLLDSGPLYAGMNVVRITDIRPAAELVNTLSP